METLSKFKLILVHFLLTIYTWWTQYGYGQVLLILLEVMFYFEAGR